MNIILYEEEQMRKKKLSRLIAQSAPDATVKAFDSMEELCQYTQNTQVKVAFINVEDYQGKGIVLAMKLKEWFPKMNLVFLGKSIKHSQLAMKLRISGYVSLPATKESIEEELACLRYE